MQSAGKQFPSNKLPACTACCSSYANCVLAAVMYSAEFRQAVHLQLHLQFVFTSVVLPTVTASRSYRVQASSSFAIVYLPALLAAVRFDSMATPVSLPTVTARIFSLPLNSALSKSLSLWAKVTHNLSIITAFVLYSNLGVLSTLRLSRNVHSLTPYFPLPTLLFSHAP